MKCVSYSTVGFTDRNIEAALDAIAEAGFTAVEILGQRPHVEQPYEGRSLVELRQQLDSRHFQHRTVHAPLTRNVLGAPDETWRQEVVDVFKAYLRFAGAVDARDIVIHPIPNPIFVPDPDNPSLADRMSDAVRRSLDDLISVAQQVGVCMALENLPYHCHYPLLSLGELRGVIDDYPAEWVGLVMPGPSATILLSRSTRRVRVFEQLIYRMLMLTIQMTITGFRHTGGSTGRRFVKLLRKWSMADVGRLR